jgi:putative FmdB family regulatory protein
VPRYDYRCVACSHEFELTQTFKEAGSGACPQCAGRGQRVYHAVPVIYKGSGFYTTDYGRPKPPAENGGKESSKESKSTETSDSSSATEPKVGATESSSSDSNSNSSSSGDSTSKSSSDPSS